MLKFKYILSVLTYQCILSISNNAYCKENIFSLKGNIGWVAPINKAKKINGYNLDKKFKSNYQTSIGAGLSITNNIRTDLIFSYIADLSYNSVISSPKGKKINEHQKIKINSLMLNFYYDFLNESKITPFIAAGIGVAHINPSNAMISSDNSPVKIIKLAEKSTNLALNINIGLTGKIKGNLYLEGGYQFAYLGSIKGFKGRDIELNNLLLSSVPYSGNKKYKLSTQTIHIGMRYIF